MNHLLPAAHALGALLVAAAPAQGVDLRNGAAKALVLRAGRDGRLSVERVRGATASDLPRPGELVVSISTTHAVGLPKLHVFNRRARPVAFRIAAMKHGRPLDASELCGRVETDSWIVLPAATTAVRLSRFVEAGATCR